MHIMTNVAEAAEQGTVEAGATTTVEPQAAQPEAAVTTEAASAPEEEAAPTPHSGGAEDRVADERVRQHHEEQMQNRINLMRAMMLSASGLSSNDAPSPDQPPQMRPRLRLPRFSGLGQKIKERRVERALENYTMMLASTTRLSLAAEEYNKSVGEKFPEFSQQIKHYADERGVSEDRIVQMLKDPSFDQRELSSSDGRSTLAAEMQSVASDPELVSMRQDMRVDADRLMGNMDQFTSWSDSVKDGKMTPEAQAAARGIMTNLNVDIREAVAEIDGLKAEEPEKPGLIEGMRDNLRNMMTKLTQTLGRMLGVKPSSPAVGNELEPSGPAPSEDHAPTA